MARRNDLFARLSLDYADHPKIAGLSDAAFRAHIEMILYSRRYMTDGHIALAIAKRWPDACLRELATNDYETPSLGIREDGSYQLHGFEEMQETRAEIEEKRRNRADAGRLGGLAKAKASAKQKVKQTASKNVAEKETETELTNKGFEAFWDAYPKKADKGQARKAFTTAAKKTSAENLINAATRYATTVQGKEKTFIKNPSTWLNAEAWNNDDAQPPPAPEPTVFDMSPEDWERWEKERFGT